MAGSRGGGSGLTGLEVWDCMGEGRNHGDGKGE